MSYSLKELLDISRLRQLLDYLDEISSMPSAILDREGNILTASGWHDICTKFHRVNPATQKKCTESDRHIKTELGEKSQHVVYNCPMGLVDAAIPVIIDGEHIGNVFTGQLFLEPPDEAFFIEQARRYGFDEGEYLAAMRKVPVIAEEKLHKYLDLVHGFTQMLAEQGLQAIRQKQAEEALKISEERFRSLIERIPNIAIQGYRLDGSVSFWNKASEMLYGYSADEALGGNLLDLIIPETMRELVVDSIKQMVATGEPIPASELMLKRKDGSLVPVFSSHALLKSGEDQAELFCLDIDMTEHVEHEREQLKIEKLESLGILAGGIAHDFNNILTAVIGNISLAQMFLEPTHKAFKQLVEAEKASVRATELSRQLLTFARGGEPLKKVVSLKQLIDESISLVLHGSNVKGVKNIQESVHAIEADEGQMSQVFHNIIINATQSMPNGGIISVDAQNEYLQGSNSMELKPGNYVRLSFADQGCGIAEGDLTRIFDPYFTTKSSGSGLGLATAHSIIKRHGGHISATSVQAKGTVFTIYLPSIGETYREYQSESATQVTEKHGGGTILVMDDEQMILEIASDMLGCLGYKVETCENGKEAVNLYKAAKEKGTPFAAVIMDLTIPGGMGGKEAAEQILAVDPKACLVVSSGYSSDPIMSSFSSYGFRGAVAKPYSLKEINQVLSTLL